MSPTNLRVAVLTALAGSLTSGTLVAGASAQDLQPALDPVVIGQGLVLSATMHAQAERDAARLRKQGRLPAVSSSAAGTRFTPSVARRRVQAAKFLTAAKRLNPEIGASLAPAFAKDPVRYAAPFLTKVGMRTDDLADLAAVYLVSSWYGAHGRTVDPTRGEVVAVRDQLRRVYAGAPKLRGASSATKQSVGEGLLYISMLNDVFVATMRAHPAAKPRLMAEIAAGAKSTFGLDLKAMRITKAGLVA